MDKEKKECPLIDLNNPNDDSRLRRNPAAVANDEQLNMTGVYNNSLALQNNNSQLPVNSSANAPIQGSYGNGTCQPSGTEVVSCMSVIVPHASATTSYLTDEDKRYLEKRGEEKKQDLSEKELAKNIENNAYKQRKQIEEIHECNKVATHPKLGFNELGELEYFFVDYRGNQKGTRQNLLNAKDFTAVILKSEDPTGSEVLIITWEHCPSDFIAFRLINGHCADEPAKFLKKLVQAGLTLNCSEEKKIALVGLLMCHCVNTKDICYVPYGHGWYWNSVKQSIDYYSDDEITFKEVLSHVQ